MDLFGKKILNQADQPIYARITAQLKDGVLPEGFLLGEQCETGFVPGGRDGVSLYHMAPLQPDPEREGKILEAFQLISKENNASFFGRIMGIFEELDRKDGIVRLYDEINHTLFVHQQEVNLLHVLNFGDGLITHGISLLAVKLGLTLLAGFSIPWIGDVHAELGAYEEFTYYAARYLSAGRVEGGNDRLFRLARQLRGWGRIYAVQFLLPDTREIRDWLLMNGADNDIIPQYSADVCLQKGEAAERLAAGVAEEEFDAISSLIAITLESGPRPGLTGADRLLPAYLAAAKDRPLNRELIRAVRDYAARELPDGAAVRAADELLQR